MQYMMIVKHKEGQGFPPKELMDAMAKLSVAPPVGAAISMAGPDAWATICGLMPNTLAMSLARSSAAFFTGPGASGRSTITVLASMVRPACAVAGPAATSSRQANTMRWRMSFIPVVRSLAERYCYR